MSRRRVVVTGLGIVCPIGNTVQPAASGGQAYPATDAILDFFDAHPGTADTGGDGT